jgi:hypothetical protein
MYPLRLVRAFVLAVIATFLVLTAHAADDKDTSPTVHVEDARTIKMSTGKDIVGLNSDQVGTFQSKPLDKGLCLIFGLAPGKGNLTLKDKDGASETFAITVRRGLLVAVGGPISWENADKKTIKKVDVDDEKIAKVETSGKNTFTLDITPVAEGETFFMLTDGDDKAERIDLAVKKASKTIAVGESATLQLTSKKAFKMAALGGSARVTWKVTDAKVTAGAVETAPMNITLVKVVNGDPKSIVVTGLNPGLARITLYDPDGKEEAIYVAVKAKN